MKKLTWTLVVLFLYNLSFSQNEWLGIVHGTEYSWTGESGVSSCNGLNPFQDYAYSDSQYEYCVSVNSRGLPDLRMESIYIAPNGDAIIGTFSGVAVYHPNQLWETYNFKTTLMEEPKPVEAVFRDSEGIIWVGLEVGGVYSLSVEDEIAEWRFYPMMIGSPFFGTAYAFREDYLGDIWACGSFGIGKYDRDLDTWTLYHSSNVSLPSGDYHDLVFDENFNIWAAHSFAGLIHFDVGTLQHTQYTTSNSSLASDFLSSIYFEEDPLLTDSKVWYGSADNGIGYFQPATNAWMHWSAADHAGFFNGQVSDIDMDETTGAFWLSTFAGVTKFENDEFETFNPSNNGFHTFQAGDIAVDTLSGQVWALSIEDGPGIYYPWGSWGQLDRFGNGAIRTNFFQKVAISPSGEAWVIGRDNPGFIALYRNGLKNASFSTQGLSYITNDIAFKDNLAYVATDNGFWSFDYRVFTDYIHHTNNGDLDEVVAVENGPLGNIWLCTKNGLFKFDGTNYTHYSEANSDLPDDWVTHVTFEPTGEVWVGTNSAGIARLDLNDNWSNFYSTSSSTIPSNKIWELAWDVLDNRILAATEGGLWHFKFTNNSEFTFAPMTASPLGSRFRSVVVDFNGTIYAGSLAAFGIWDPVNGWDIYDDSNSALADDPINDIAIDQEGNKWIVGFSSTRGGLYRFTDGGPGTDPNQIQVVRGIAFIDINENGAFDSFEFPLTKSLVKMTRDGIAGAEYRITGEDGSYQFAINENGFYNIEVFVDDMFNTTPNPMVYQMDFNNPGPNPDTLDPMGFRPLIEGTTRFEIDFTNFKYRCNEEIGVFLDIKNVGNLESVDPMFNLYWDTDLTDYQASVFEVATELDPNRLLWEPEQASPLQEWFSYIIFDAPSENDVGDFLCFEIQALDSLLLTNPILDFEIECDEIKCGFDPNDKLVDPPGIGDNNDTHPDSTLTYTVRFQNTGNDYAYNVSIRDTLDPNLEIETFRFISSSHPVIIDWLPGNIINFGFPGIMLPDSATSYLLSQGFVKYSISAIDGVPENTIVTNTAYITFDQNTPIQTNTVFNTLTTMITSVEDQQVEEIGDLVIYPNPSDRETMIEFDNPFNKSVEINLYSMLGEKLRSWSGIKASRYTIYRDGLPSGMYAIEVVTGNIRFSGKLVFY